MIGNVRKIGNTATNVDNQRLSWQQNRQQTGNKAATFWCIRLNLAKFDHPRRAGHRHTKTTSPRLKLVIKDEVIFQPGQLPDADGHYGPSA